MSDDFGISGIYEQLIVVNKTLGEVQSDIRGIRVDLKNHYSTNDEITKKIDAKLRQRSSDKHMAVQKSGGPSAKQIGKISALAMFVASWIYTMITGKPFPGL